MRLLITTDTAGGVWTFTQELATGLLQRDCSVLLVSFGRKPSAAQLRQCDTLRRDFRSSFRYVASEVPLEWMDANEKAFSVGAELLHREAAAFAPDLLHSNQFCYGAFPLNLPRVITAHSDVLSWAKACRNESLPDTQWLRNYIAQVQAGLASADAVVAPTRWMMSALEESFTLPECRAIVPNGRAVPATFDAPRILCAVTAGRLWDEAKGISILQHVKSPIPILIAGESQFDSARQTQLIGDSRAVGFLSEPQMLDLCRHSILYLCLSCYEPFGLAAVEAARSGCAVIARNIASQHEVWEDGALYFDDADSLSALLDQLSRSPQLLEQVRRRSFNRSQVFSRDRMIDNYLQLYEHVQMKFAKVENVA
jgi:glycosyltransferase involved in cell wall biosynthesis